MSKTKRDHAYLWVTWVSKMMAGACNCHWSLWMKAHYKDLPTQERGEDKDDHIRDWTANHVALLNETKAEYEANGYTCYTEDQAGFCMVGKTGVSVAGKCDLVCIKGDEAVVIDIKTGKKRLSDYFQVMIYLIALRVTRGPWTGKIMRGLVVYPKPEKPVDVPSENIEGNMENFRKAIAIISGDAEAKKCPSYQECRYCEMPMSECPDRVKDKPKSTQVDLF